MFWFGRFEVMKNSAKNKRAGYERILVLTVLLIWQTHLFTQQADTIIWMDELSVAGRSLIGTEADSLDVTDPVNRMGTLTDLLRTESNIYFRDFGPGSSSTISMFGSKSNEVALVWNGIKVANPMLGVNDYSMISPADMTSLRVARVGSSTAYGSGSGAGAILLDQGIGESAYPVSLSAGWSSINQLTGAIDYTRSEGKWKSRTSVSGQISKNNYSYTNLAGDQDKLPHARSHFLNASHHSEFHVASNQSWTMSIWTRKHYREIPPLLTESRSEADQADAFVRSVVQYHYLQPRHRLHIKAYYGFQNQHYQNPLISLNAHHRFRNGQLRMDNEWQPVPKIYVKYGLQNNYFSSLSDNYRNHEMQNRISTYAQAHYELNILPLEVILLGQPEWVSGQKTGWTTEMKIRYQHALFGRWSIFANKNIVWPTLNDLYWVPGGNPDLLPEHNRMGGLSWKKDWPENLQSSTTFYYREANNWIQWLPGDLGFWSPVNAHKGRSFGMNVELQKDFNKHVSTKGGYQFVRTFVLDERAAHHQAIYTPRHMWSIHGSYHINTQWEVRLYGEFTSTRYVTKDHSVLLKPYFLGHAVLNYNVRNLPWTIGLQVRNLFDTDYQGIKNRPMPGRQFEFNTHIKI